VVSEELSTREKREKKKLLIAAAAAAAAAASPEPFHCLGCFVTGRGTPHHQPCSHDTTLHGVCKSQHT
jgi:hypothetical protein